MIKCFQNKITCTNSKPTCVKTIIFCVDGNSPANRTRVIVSMASAFEMFLCPEDMREHSVTHLCGKPCRWVCNTAKYQQLWVLIKLKSWAMCFRIPSSLQTRAEKRRPGAAGTLVGEWCLCWVTTDVCWVLNLNLHWFSSGFGLNSKTNTNSRDSLL